MKFANTTTTREQRRRQEREQRQQERRQEAADKLAAWRAMPPEERAKYKATQEAIDRIQRNGITLDDLEQNHKVGFDEGFRLGCEQTFESTFAAICLALNELHGFGAKRCMDVLNLTHEKVYYCLSRADIIQEVWDKMKLTINFKDAEPGELVELKEDDE